MFKVNSFITSKEEVIFYPYRKARVLGPIKYTPDTNELRDFMIELCDETTKIYVDGNLQDRGITVIAPDNHICFKVGEIYLMFSDGSLTIGSEIEIM